MKDNFSHSSITTRIGLYCQCMVSDPGTRDKHALTSVIYETVALPQRRLFIVRQWHVVQRTVSYLSVQKSTLKAAWFSHEELQRTQVESSGKGCFHFGSTFRSILELASTLNPDCLGGRRATAGVCFLASSSSVRQSSTSFCSRTNRHF